MKVETDIFDDPRFVDIPLGEKPFPNEHACRLRPPGRFVRFRRSNCFRRSGGKCIDYIFGRRQDGNTEVQAMRYKKQAWEAGAARSHCRRRGGSFEAASG